ncbi:hypothetical protein BJ741DRAFT_604698 [Chytriomyces cf. hyalinus JEL632]|nr:hypothetical protein BJ741DRAFT_604698 [Chytriomyces cf. hyalinus JEL632]
MILASEEDPTPKHTTSNKRMNARKFDRSSDAEVKGLWTNPPAKTRTRPTEPQNAGRAMMAPSAETITHSDIGAPGGSGLKSSRKAALRQGYETDIEQEKTVASSTLASPKRRGRPRKASSLCSQRSLDTQGLEASKSDVSNGEHKKDASISLSNDAIEPRNDACVTTATSRKDTAKKNIACSQQSSSNQQHQQQQHVSPKRGPGRPRKNAAPPPPPPPPPPPAPLPFLEPTSPKQPTAPKSEIEIVSSRKGSKSSRFSEKAFTTSMPRKRVRISQTSNPKTLETTGNISGEENATLSASPPDNSRVLASNSDAATSADSLFQDDDDLFIPNVDRRKKAARHRVKSKKAGMSGVQAILENADPIHNLSHLKLESAEPSSTATLSDADMVHDLALDLSTPVESAAKSKSNSDALQPPRKCAYCRTIVTPMWRHGPLGFERLCNSCGVKWKRGKITLPSVPEVRLFDALMEDIPNPIAKPCAMRGPAANRIGDDWISNDSSFNSASSSEDEAALPLKKRRSGDCHQATSLITACSSEHRVQQAFGTDIDGLLDFSSVKSQPERTAFLTRILSHIPSSALSAVAERLRGLSTQVQESASMELEQSVVSIENNCEFELDFGEMDNGDWCALCQTLVDTLRS